LHWQIYDWKSETTKIVKNQASGTSDLMNAKGLCSIKQKAGNVTVQGEVFYRSDLGSSKGKNLIVDRYIAEETLRNKVEGNS
jgi:hypothetical protein